MEGGETVTHRLSLVIEVSLCEVPKCTCEHLPCSFLSLLVPLIGHCKSAVPFHLIWCSLPAAAANEPNLGPSAERFHQSHPNYKRTSNKRGLRDFCGGRSLCCSLKVFLYWFYLWIPHSGFSIATS